MVSLSSMKTIVNMIKSVGEIFANGDKIVILLIPSSLFALKFYCVRQILNIQLLLVSILRQFTLCTAKRKPIVSYLYW